MNNVVFFENISIKKLIKNNLNKINNPEAAHIVIFWKNNKLVHHVLEKLYSWNDIETYYDDNIDLMKETINDSYDSYYDNKKLKLLIFNKYQQIRTNKKYNLLQEEIFFNSRVLKLKCIHMDNYFVNYRPEFRYSIDYIFITSKLFFGEVSRFYYYVEKFIDKEIYDLIFKGYNIFSNENRNDLIIFDGRKHLLYLVKNIIYWWINLFFT